MSTAVNMTPTSIPRTRGEIIIIAVAVALICVLLTTITMLAKDQVHKAELRDALRQSQRTAMARCWQDSRDPRTMRSCMQDVSLQTAQALDQSYGKAVAQGQQAPVMARSDVSLASFRY